MQACGNEYGVGEGIRFCGVPREQIFVTSKAAAEYRDYKTTADSIDELSRKMGLGFVIFDKDTEFLKNIERIRITENTAFPVFGGKF